MKAFKSRCLAGIIVLAILCGTAVANAKDKKNNKNDNTDNGNGKNQNQQPQNNPGANAGATGPERRRSVSPPGGDGGQSERPAGRKVDRGGAEGGGAHERPVVEKPKNEPKVDKIPEKPAVRSLPPLKTHATPDGGYEKTASSGRVRERMEKKNDGEHVSVFSPGGSKQREEINRPDGSKQSTQFDLGGRRRREELKQADGSRQVDNHQYGRGGTERGKETIKYDSHNKIVSKTTVKIVNKTVITTHYGWGHYGYVYQPVVFVADPFWGDPYWYSPAGVVVVHPFNYSWGWSGGWYGSYGPYFTTYPVYPAPSYWVTDWMVAGYLQEHYDASMSAQQAREEASAARDEAEKARQTAEKAQDQAEIAEAKAAQAEAELHAKNAEAKAARLETFEAQAGKANPSATPIDKDTKEQLRTQIEQNIAEKKDLAAQTKPAMPDVSKALADPKHIYPVSKTISVTTPEAEAAGSLSEGDLLKIAPGQEEALKTPNPDMLVKMTVITSKGEDSDEVPAGKVINVSLRDLQDFDSEFRAKLDTGLEEAAKNKDAFKEGATKS
jgi:hypothetical protein